MPRLLISSFLLCWCFFSQAQFNIENVKPDSSTFENIYVKKIAEDKLQSTYAIWVKEKVKPHYHANHTEVVFVVSGRGMMRLGDEVLKIKKGSVIRIPAETVHAVVTTSRKPLKVISIQAPKFDGDRVWVN